MVKEPIEPMTPVTIRYILLGLKENPQQYMPRTPVQTEALWQAALWMEEYSQQAVVKREHIDTISMLSSRPTMRVQVRKNFAESMQAAMRAVDIAVKEYKHDQVVGDYYAKFRRKEDADE